MSEIGDIYKAIRAVQRRERNTLLETASTKGWTKHTAWHFSKVINGTRVDWWPSRAKARVNGKMIYGPDEVEAMVKSLSDPPSATADDSNESGTMSPLE